MAKAQAAPTNAFDLSDPRFASSFASMMCLILDRYLRIKGYRVPSRDPLLQAAEIFERLVASEIGPSDSGQKSMKVTPWLEALSLIENREHPPEEATAEGFSKHALSILRGLLDTPETVTTTQKQELKDFFASLERITREESAGVRTCV